MASTWVLKFPQVDKVDQPILVHVTQKLGTTVDLDLLATDGEEAYRGKVRQRHLPKLRSKNFEGTDDEWLALIRYALVSKQDSNAREDQASNLEVDCTIMRGKLTSSLSITLRSRIEDITHKLGAIELAFSENTDDVDLFGWACQLADQTARLEAQAMVDRREANGTVSTVKNLEKKLAELVEAKKEHEDQLLTKFAMLLNEKKAKIRDQQRVLQTARVDQTKIDEFERMAHSRETEMSSGKRKRGQNAPQGSRSHDDGSSDGFEAMDIDKTSADDDQDGGQSGQSTPVRSEGAETETASEGEDPAAPAEPLRSSGLRPDNSKKASPPPPPRTLPFQKRNQKAGPAESSSHVPASRTDLDEETETEEDEL